MNIIEQISPIYSYDWRIFMAAANQWWNGGNPYGQLLSPVLPAGAFAYPPTALSWMCLFLPFGGFGFYVWTALQLGGWFLIIRRYLRSQVVLLCWSPLVMHLILGQNTLAVVLALWAATAAKRRGFMWGTVVAWALTKPQVALIPVIWLLWKDRREPHRCAFWSGIIAGTVALAVPPTLADPAIWGAWLNSLNDYRARVLLMAPWQGFGALVLIAAAVLWYGRYRGRQEDAGWQWWLSAALFPQGALYSSVVLMPLLRPRADYWTIAGLAVSSILIGPATEVTLPIILSGHIFAAWLICGGTAGPGYGQQQAERQSSC